MSVLEIREYRRKYNISYDELRRRTLFEETEEDDVSSVTPIEATMKFLK